MHTMTTTAPRYKGPAPEFVEHAQAFIDKMQAGLDTMGPDPDDLDYQFDEEPETGEALRDILLSLRQDRILANILAASRES